MIGFYLSINKREKSAIELSSVTFESFCDLDTVEQNKLYIYQDSNDQMHTSQGYTFYNIGTLSYKRAWRKKALELICHDLEKGESIQNIMQNTGGQFCLIIHRHQDVCVITDKMASFPVFKYEDPNRVNISNIFLLVAKHGHVSMDYQSIAEYLSFDYCFHSTFFNEIEHLEMGTLYQFGEESKIKQYDDYLSGLRFNKYRTLEEISQKSKEIMLQNFSFLRPKDKVFVDITGGFDTRTIAVMLNHMNLNFVGGICGEQILKEADIAAQVAEQLAVNFFDNIKITDQEKFSKILDRHFKITNGVPILYDSSELINYYEFINRNFDIHLTGFAGSQLWDNFLPRLGFFSSRLKLTALFEKYYKYKNIFDNRLMTQKRFYNDLSKKIKQLFIKIGSNRHEDVASFFTTSTFSKYYHGSLLGTHNTIMPIYAPFLEANFAKIMIETSFKIKNNRSIQRTLITELNENLSLLMTSHGFNANIRTKSNIGAKKILRNVARGLMYDFDTLLKLQRFFQSMKKPQPKPAQFQRSFWIDAVNYEWSDHMNIFEIIDPNKLIRHFEREDDPSRLKAKIIYINKLIDECKPRY